MQKRLDYLRGEIEAERISYGEIAELQSLTEHIDPSDTVLLEWAGVPEYTADAMTDEHPAQPVADMRGVMYCGRCGKPTRQRPDGRFPIHASV